MQVSWIEADDLKGLLARISLPDNTPTTPKPEEPGLSLLAAPDDAFLITDLDAPVRDPFDALAPAAAFVDSQPAVADFPVPRPLPAPAAAPPAFSSATTPPAEAEKPASLQEAPAAEPAPAIPPLSRIRDKLRAIRQRAHEAGMLSKANESSAAESPPFPPAPAAEAPAPVITAAAALPAFPPFIPPAGTTQERLAAFAAWSRLVLNEEGAHLLVMNDDGELLWGGEAKAGLVLSAMMAWNATMRASAHAAWGNLPIMRQSLASGHVLTVIPCKTRPGTLLHIAVAAPESLPDLAASELRKALVKALTGQTED